MVLKKLFVTLIAILGYGGWAVYSNMLGQDSQMHMTAWRAGILQGAYAGLLTYINIALLETFYRKMIRQYTAGITVVTVLTGVTLAQYALIIPAHLINGTPNIFITLLPGFLIGTTFSLAYLINMKKALI